MKRRVIILGSTGSVGQSTLDVLLGLGGEWELAGLAASSSHDELARQANRFRPDAVAITSEHRGGALDEALDHRSRLFVGDNALVDLIESVECDCVVSAVVGSGGLAATLRAAELGRRIALANKEALVIAGSLLVDVVRRGGAEIIPVDSEHSAIFQALHAGRSEDVSRIHLTASGGPFRTWSVEEMERVTVEDALCHPTWSMGPKITIDSATMMNKALEIVEARWLFDLDSDRIDVVIHPECVVHSLVEFRDGSVVAQLGSPDMRTPIQYALTYPKRLPCPSDRLDFSQISQLNFEEPDFDRFPALGLGHDAAARGGTAGAVLNAANEAAVTMFREGAIGFLDISRLTERALTQHEFISSPTLDDLLVADRWAKDEVARCTTC